MPRDRRAALVLLTPLLAVIGLIIVVPVAGTIVNSLFRDVVYLPPLFVGLEHYGALAGDPGFRQSLAFTILFTLVSVPIEMILGLGLALLLHEVFAFRGLLRATLLVPWAIPAAVSGRLFELVYSYGSGGANHLLERLGLVDGPVHWLGSELGAFTALVVADTWKTTPFVAIIILAGLSSIPAELYEQARIDRATMLQRLRHVTLPLLRPVLVVALLFRSIETLRIFDLVYVLTGGGPGGSTSSLSLFAYDYLTSGDFGYGSAASVVLFLLALVLSLLYVRLGRFGEALR